MDTNLQYHVDAEKWFCLTTTEKIGIAISATRRMDRRYRFYGTILFVIQALEWPRTRNFDRKGLLIEQGGIPSQLEEGQALMGLALAVDPELEELASTSDVVRTWSTDGLAVGFDTGAAMAERKADESLMGDRLVDVDFLLKSIGEPRSAAELGEQKRKTLVR